jgi:hypothetical protein
MCIREEKQYRNKQKQNTIPLFSIFNNSSFIVGGLPFFLLASYLLM